MGREGAVASIKSRGGLESGSYRQHQQMVFTSGQEGGAGRPWAWWVGAGRRGPDKPTSCVFSEVERAWSWRGLSVLPSLPLSRHTSQKLTSGRSSCPRKIVLGPELELPGSTLGRGQWKDGMRTLSSIPEVGRADYDLLVWPYFLSHPCYTCWTDGKPKL